VFGARETTHNKLNANLGLPDDPTTEELFQFLSPLIGGERSVKTHARDAQGAP
jgi:hypothetical protein